jgi:hypothetical protein
MLLQDFRSTARYPWARGFRTRLSTHDTVSIMLSRPLRSGEAGLSFT